VFAADQRELKVLDEFIVYKKKLVLRSMDPMKNMEVVDKTCKFKDCLESFPQLNREGKHDLPFWPSNMLNQNRDDNTILNGEEEGPNSSVAVDVEKNIIGSVVDLIMSMMPNPERRGYFGPCKDRLLQEVSQRVTRGRKRGGNKELATEIH